MVDEALKLRREYRVPFWEAVLLIARRDSIEVDAVLEAANHHQPMEAFKNIDLVANSVTPETLDGLITSLESNQVLTFSSQITLIDGSTIHIPMLDFRIRPNPENLNLATMIVDHAGLSGHIFDSGNSYHFYGTSTVDGAAGLANFLGKFSLFAPFVDQRWIAHQLIEGACALRISRGKNFAEPPRQVRYVATPGSNRTALGS
ncbi:hypothetical protein Dvina_45305 [Dactylosporangium vinaceum]|uniref:Uncharacterized protein n=1 Tax=Dactylosporangium vinaceum TaxID=53362 RepID=A0ABV5LZ13_9ACTN|nr:hypothetical protein [Dactylosporangium vinaceum]UAB95188.1 hypothetical protein Dvina_45305 [Dactylosporangium vinaceum]